MAINKVVYGGSTLIDLTGDTLDDAAKLLSGVTAHGKDGVQLTGTCDYDVNSTETTNPITAARVRSGYIGFVNGQKITGTMASRGTAGVNIADLNPISKSAGYYSAGTQQIDPTEAAKIIANNIRDGVTLLSVTGGFSNFTVTDSTTIPATGGKTLSFSAFSLGGKTPKYVAIYCTSGSYNGTSSVPVYCEGWIDLTGISGVISRHTKMYTSTAAFFNGNSSSNLTYTVAANSCSVTLNNDAVFKSGATYYMRVWA